MPPDESSNFVIAKRGAVAPIFRGAVWGTYPRFKVPGRNRRDTGGKTSYSVYYGGNSAPNLDGATLDGRPAGENPATTEQSYGQGTASR